MDLPKTVELQIYYPEPKFLLRLPVNYLPKISLLELLETIFENLPANFSNNDCDLRLHWWNY